MSEPEFSLKEHIIARDFAKYVAQKMRKDEKLDGLDELIQAFFRSARDLLPPGSNGSDSAAKDKFYEIISNVKFFTDKGGKRVRLSFPSRLILTFLDRFAGYINFDTKSYDNKKIFDEQDTPAGPSEPPTAPKSERTLDAKSLALQNEIDRLKGEIQQLNSIVTNSKKESAQLRDSIGQLQDKLTAATAELENLKLANVNVGKMSAEVSDLKKKLSQIEAKNVSLSGDVARISTERQRLLDQILELQTAKRRLEERNAKIITSLMAGKSLDSTAEIENQIAELQDSEERYQLALQELQNLESTIQAIDLATYAERSGTTSIQIVKKWQSKIGEYRNRIDKLTADLRKAQSKNEDITVIQAERDSALTLVEQLEAKLADSRRRSREGQDAELADVLKKLDAANNEIKRLQPIRERVIRLQEQYQIKGTPSAAFDTFIRQYEQQIQQLQQKEAEINELRNENMQLRNLNKDANEEIDKLQEQIRKLHDALANASDEQTQKLLQDQIIKVIELQAEVVRVDELQKRYKKIANDREQVISQQSGMLREYDERYRRFAQMTRENLDLAADYSADKERLEAKIKELEKQMKQSPLASQEYKDLLKEYTELKDQAEQLENMYEQEIQAKAVIKNKLETLFEEAKDRFSQYETTIGQLRAARDEIATQYQNTFDQLRAAENDLLIERNRVFQNEDRIQELQTEILQLQNNLRMFRENEQELLDENTNLINRNRELQGNIDRLTQENNDLLAQIAAGPLIVPAAAVVAAPVAGGPGPGGPGGPGPGGPGGPGPGGPGGPARRVVAVRRAPAPAPNIFPGDNMNVVARGQDLTYVSQIDQFLDDLTVAILAAAKANEPIDYRRVPLTDYPTVTNWETAQTYLKERGMIDLGDITENPKQLKLYMEGQARRANLRTGMGSQLFQLKILPLRFKPRTSEYQAGPAVKSITALPGGQRVGTSDLGTIVIPGQSNYSLRRQGLNYVVTSAGKSQSFGSERDANYFIQTGGFGRKTYGPITERVFGTPVKNVSQAIY